MIIKELNHNSLLKENSKLDLENLNLGSFPTRKEERWRYTPLRALKKINFHNQLNFKIENLNSFGIPKIEGLVIVLENGKFNSDLSNLIDLKEIELSFDKENVISKSSDETKLKDYFTNLNLSFLSEKVVLKIKANFTQINAYKTMIAPILIIFFIKILSLMRTSAFLSLKSTVNSCK